MHKHYLRPVAAVSVFYVRTDSAVRDVVSAVSCRLSSSSSVADWHLLCSPQVCVIPADPPHR